MQCAWISGRGDCLGLLAEDLEGWVPMGLGETLPWKGPGHRPREAPDLEEADVAEDSEGVDEVPKE